MSRFAKSMERHSRSIDKHLSDCWVTIGNTAGLASSLRPSVSPENVYDDEQNLKMRAMFESPYVVDIEREGYEITLGMENPTPIKNTQNVAMLRRFDRLLVEPDNDERTAVQLVYGITHVEPDSKWRVFLRMQLLGPLCQEAPQYNALPYTLPIILGGATFDECAQLDTGEDFAKRFEAAALPLPVGTPLGTNGTPLPTPYDFIE